MSVAQSFSRLPGCVVPKHYNLRLKPDLEKFTFKGWLTIDLNVLTPTSEIVLNAAELELSSVTLSSPPSVIAQEKCILDAEAETLTLKLEKELQVGQTQLICSYTGTLNDKMRGFYRSKYTTPAGETRHCATTQFESTDARRCLPCWDEPKCKATFSVSVIAPSDRTVHSNMPEVESSVTEKGDQLDEMAEAEVESGQKLVRFQPSPIMSTYLLAVIVGEFEGINSKTKDGILVRAFTPVGKTEQGRFALDTSVRALEFYTEYFNVAYPLPKYDCIAIADFQCGAMENWGLVTYRESCILVDPENTSAASRQWVAIVVNHEMAHQWFGNLVTMEWWTHLWLNEGFASFMENYCTDALFPQFGIFTQFVSNTLIPALGLDALENSHPIEVEVGHPSEVDEIFDNISYNKGASVIRMLHDFIGNDAFRRGMNAYLKKHSYQNALTGDLWKSLEEASNQKVGEIMDTFTGQMGFPVVKVGSVTHANGKTTLSLSQEKFNADGSESKPEKKWNIPMTAMTSEGKSSRFVMGEMKMDQEFETKSAEDWVKLNSEFIGYYRVQYSAEYLLGFKSAMESKKLNELDRLNLLDDLVALVQAGRVSTDVPLKMITGCKSDDSYVVWSCINSFFGKLSGLLHDDDCYPEYKRFVLATMGEVVDSIGWTPKEGEHHVRGLLRMLVISRAGQLGHETVSAEARKRFKDHVGKAATIPADLRAPIYRVVAATGGDEVFQQLQAMYKQEELHEEKDRIARAMGSAKDAAVLEKVLAFAVSDAVRAQDSPFILVSVAQNPAGRELAWQFFKTNYAMLNERYKSGMLMTRLVTNMDGFCSEEKAAEVAAFFKENPSKAPRSVQQTVENIRLNAAWIKRDGDKIREFFKGQ